MDTVMRKKTKKAFGPDTTRATAQPVSPLAYGIEDAADTLGLSRSRIYELIAVGDITACKVGKRTIIPAAELTAFLERHRVESSRICRKQGGIQQETSIGEMLPPHASR
jgi:excisionase family DNA binding protein